MFLGFVGWLASVWLNYLDLYLSWIFESELLSDSIWVLDLNLNFEVELCSDLISYLALNLFFICFLFSFNHFSSFMSGLQQDFYSLLSSTSTRSFSLGVFDSGVFHHVFAWRFLFCFPFIDIRMKGVAYVVIQLCIFFFPNHKLNLVLVSQLCESSYVISFSCTCVVDNI